MDHSITEGARIVRIDLQQQNGTLLYHIHFIDGADRQGHIAMGIHGRNRGHQHRTAILAANAIHSLTENTGGVLRYGTDQPLGIGLTQRGREEPAVMLQHAVHLRIVEKGIVHRGNATLQDDILHTGFLQVLHLHHNGIRAGGGHGREDKVVVLNMLQKLLGAHALGFI